MNLAEVRVHNRVNVALPTIPEPCRQLGISVRKIPAGPPLFWLALTSADPKHDEAFLRIHALLYLKPEFARIPGVTDVRVVGIEDFGLKVWLNPIRLASYRVGTGEVIDALRRQNAQVGTKGAIGGPALQYTVTASGRLTKSEEFANVILRANPDGEVLRLKDVARVEFGAPKSGFTLVDGKPAALIAITAWPGRVTADQFRQADVVEDLPPGVRFDVVADRSADRFLSVEVQLPPGSALGLTEPRVAQATELIRGLPGNPGTFGFTEGREPNAATIFVKVRTKGGPTAAEVGKALFGLNGAKIRVGDVLPGEEAFPVRIALTDPSAEFMDPSERGDVRFREAAERILAKLVKDKEVAEPAAFPVSPVPQRAVDVDRDICSAAQCGAKRTPHHAPGRNRRCLRDRFPQVRVGVQGHSAYGTGVRPIP